MSLNIHIPLLFGVLTLTGIFLCSDIRSQTGDNTGIINFPLPHEDFSLYDFAVVRFETDKTEVPPADLVKRDFWPVTEIFKKDSLYFSDSVKSFWIKIEVANNQSSDTTIALVFKQPGWQNRFFHYSHCKINSLSRCPDRPGIKSSF